MSSTRIRRQINAPRAAVYRALLDARAVAKWMVPTGMTSHVHAFDPREGGTFRISLTYDEPTGTGKTTAHTDTFYGRFVKLVPDRQVVEVVEFETDDPAMRGEMRITLSLADVDGVPPSLDFSPNVTERAALLCYKWFVENNLEHDKGDSPWVQTVPPRASYFKVPAVASWWRRSMAAGSARTAAWCCWPR